MLSTLQQIVYFVNHRDPAHPEGYVLLAPYSDMPTPEGYSREYTRTLSDVDRLDKILREQTVRQMEIEGQISQALWDERSRAIRDSLTARMVSSSTSEYEREFIRLYLQLREEKRERHKRQFECRAAYLWQTAHETPKDRQVNEEKVNLDRINF